MLSKILYINMIVKFLIYYIYIYIKHNDIFISGQYEVIKLVNL